MFRQLALDQLHQLLLAKGVSWALFVALHVVAGINQLSGDLASMEIPAPQRLRKSNPINFRAGCKLVRGTYMSKV